MWRVLLATYVQTWLVINHLVEGCESLLQKVESSCTFSKLCTYCAFYRPKANLFCSPRVILSNQKSVFSQLATT